MGEFSIGQAVTRLEDPRLLRGQGRFLDDMVFGRQVHAAIVRSPHAHAEIRAIDGAAALAAPGVLAVLTGADYRADDQGTSAANTDRTDYSVGVTYAMGPWTIGAAYAHGEVEAGFGLGQDETDGYQVGAVYALGQGVTLTSGITHWNVDDNLNAVGIENTATVFVFGSILSF